MMDMEEMKRQRRMRRQKMDAENEKDGGIG